MADDSLEGNTRQQIGEILATVRGLVEGQKERVLEARASEARTTQQITDVKYDINSKLQVNSSRLEVLEAQFQRHSVRFETFSEVTQRDTNELRAKLTEIKGPVEQLGDLRKRLIGMGVILVGFTYAVATLLHPIWEGLVTNISAHLGWK